VDTVPGGGGAVRADAVDGAARAQGALGPGPDGGRAAAPRTSRARGRRGGRGVDKALALVDPLEKDYLARLRGMLRHPSETKNPTNTFTRFDPQEVRLVGDTVKVRGRMAAKKGEDGKAVIQADYSFVCPLRHASGSEEVTRVMARRTLTVEVVPTGGRWEATEGRLRIVRHQGDNAGIRCFPADGLLHAEFPSERTRHAPDSSLSDPYDRNQAVVEDECYAISRV
jgi:hypothetical protein